MYKDRNNTQVTGVLEDAKKRHAFPTKMGSAASHGRHESPFPR